MATKRSRDEVELDDAAGWTAHDDLLLVHAVQQTCDLATARHSVKFSAPRSPRAIERRWSRLLRDADASRDAVERVLGLGLQPGDLPSGNVPWSDVELTAVVASPVRKKPKGAAPKYTAGEAQAIMSSAPGVFHASRTPAAVVQLMSRLWFFEHQAELSLATDFERFPHKLQDVLRRVSRQAEFTFPREVILPAPPEKPRLKGPRRSAAYIVPREPEPDVQVDVGVEDFDASAAAGAAAAVETSEDAPQQEAVGEQGSKEALRKRHFFQRRRHMLQLESEIAADRYFEFGKRTLAVLRGEFARFEIRSKEALIGHKTDTNNVDIDLAKAGAVSRVSRRQAILRLEPDCCFHVLNIGARPLYVCGEPVMPATNCTLRDGDLLEIGGLPFIFNSNNWLLNKARKHCLE
eukprot:Unigene10567_Nuclearia_a/m.32314 Unigene10567_Nuclearia_a/g.32314  ORF Unigene10567_Nuclearia_a/g.32314 Unigene10567_Nuclearia_a/m.32314 type:complete len:406 (+) Unigene10567_Nuclearia_a:27-1244(+)